MTILNGKNADLPSKDRATTEDVGDMKEALCETARGRPSPYHPVGGAHRIKWPVVGSGPTRDIINKRRREICIDKECDLRARDNIACGIDAVRDGGGGGYSAVEQ